jgi:hypothetical protein
MRRSEWAKAIPRRVASPARHAHRQRRDRRRVHVGDRDGVWIAYGAELRCSGKRKWDTSCVNNHEHDAGLAARGGIPDGRYRIEGHKREA